jgi:hypothetical protein
MRLWNVQSKAHPILAIVFSSKSLVYRIRCHYRPTNSPISSKHIFLQLQRFHTKISAIWREKSRFCKAAPYVASWSHTESLNSTALRASIISADQSSRTCDPKYFNASPTCPLSNSSSSSSKSSASTCPTLKAGLVPSLPLMLSHVVIPARPNRPRGKGNRLSCSFARDASCCAAKRDCASTSRACRRAASRRWARANSLFVIEVTLEGKFCVKI